MSPPNTEMMPVAGAENGATMRVAVNGSPKLPLYISPSSMNVSCTRGFRSRRNPPCSKCHASPPQVPSGVLVPEAVYIFRENTVRANLAYPTAVACHYRYRGVAGRLLVE